MVSIKQKAFLLSSLMSLVLVSSVSAMDFTVFGGGVTDSSQHSGEKREDNLGKIPLEESGGYSPEKLDEFIGQLGADQVGGDQGKKFQEEGSEGEGSLVEEDSYQSQNSTTESKEKSSEDGDTHHVPSTQTSTQGGGSGEPSGSSAKTGDVQEPDDERNEKSEESGEADDTQLKDTLENKKKKREEETKELLVSGQEEEDKGEEVDENDETELPLPDSNNSAKRGSIIAIPPHLADTGLAAILKGSAYGLKQLALRQDNAPEANYKINLAQYLKYIQAFDEAATDNAMLSAAQTLAFHLLGLNFDPRYTNSAWVENLGRTGMAVMVNQGGRIVLDKLNDIEKIKTNDVVMKVKTKYAALNPKIKIGLETTARLSVEQGLWSLLKKVVGVGGNNNPVQE